MDPGGTAERLEEIVNFWKNKYRRWRRPLSRYVTYFKAVLPLYNVQNLSKNAEVAINRLFRGGVEFSIAKIDGTNLYIAHCRGPDGFIVKGNRGSNPKAAKSSAAYLALRSALGPDFFEYKGICHPCKHEGISPESLRNALCEAFPLWMSMIKTLPYVDNSGERIYPSTAGRDMPEKVKGQASGANKIQKRVNEPTEKEVPIPQQTEGATASRRTTEVGPDSEPSSNRCAGQQPKVSVDFSSDILYWDPIKWMPLTKKQREDKLYDFWSSTSRFQFPKTFNLFGERNLTTTNCARAVMLLFMGDQSQIIWQTLDEDRGIFQVRCKWRDFEGGWTEPVTGSGSRPDEAKNDAAKKCLRIILGPNNFKILQHVSRPFFVEGPEDKKVDVAGLKRRLLHAKAPPRNTSEGASDSSEKSSVIEVANCSKTADEHTSAPIHNPDQLAASSTEHRKSPAKSISQKCIGPASSSSTKSPTQLSSTNDSASKLSQSIQQSTSSAAKEPRLEKKTSKRAASATKATELVRQTAAITVCTSAGNSSQNKIKNAGKSANVVLVSTNAAVQDGTRETTLSAVTPALELVSSSSECHLAKNNSRAEVEVACKSGQPSTQSLPSSDPTSGQKQSQPSTATSVEPAVTSAAVDNAERCDTAIPVPLLTRSGEAETENPLSSSANSVNAEHNNLPAVVSEILTVFSIEPSDSVSHQVESDPEKNLAAAQQSVLLSTSSTEDPIYTVLVPNQLVGEHSALSEDINLVPPLIRPDPGHAERVENMLDTVIAQPPQIGPQNEKEEIKVLGDPFAEYFSTCDDGSIKVPPWLTKYLDDIKTTDFEKQQQHCDRNECCKSTESKTETPFLPFDEIIGYEYPQEAGLALGLLFEGRQEPQPMYDTTKYVLCEVVVGSQVFLGLGPTEEEARENAAKEAIRALEEMGSLSEDQTGDCNNN